MLAGRPLLNGSMSLLAPRTRPPRNPIRASRLTRLKCRSGVIGWSAGLFRRGSAGSATDPCRQVRGIAIPLHRDLGECAGDLAEIVWRNLDAGSAKVFF